MRRFGEPTWQKLVEAVNSPAGGADTAHARGIAGRHKAGGMSIKWLLSINVIFGQLLWLMHAVQLTLYCVLGKFFLLIIHKPCRNNCK